MIFLQLPYYTKKDSTIIQVTLYFVPGNKTYQSNLTFYQSQNVHAENHWMAAYVALCWIQHGLQCFARSLTWASGLVLQEEGPAYLQSPSPVVTLQTIIFISYTRQQSCINTMAIGECELLLTTFFTDNSNLWKGVTGNTAAERTVNFWTKNNQWQCSNQPITGFKLQQPL